MTRFQPQLSQFQSCTLDQAKLSQIQSCTLDQAKLTNFKAGQFCSFNAGQLVETINHLTVTHTHTHTHTLPLSHVLVEATVISVSRKLSESVTDRHINSYKSIRSLMSCKCCLIGVTCCDNMLFNLHSVLIES